MPDGCECTGSNLKISLPTPRCIQIHMRLKLPRAQSYLCQEALRWQPKSELYGGQSPWRLFKMSKNNAWMCFVLLKTALISSQKSCTSRRNLKQNMEYRQTDRAKVPCKWYSAFLFCKLEVKFLHFFVLQGKGIGGSQISHLYHSSQAPHPV